MMKKEIAKLPAKVVISNLVSNVFYHVWRIKEEYLKKNGLSISAREMHTLSIISMNQGESMKKIAQILKIDKSTLSTNCKRLIDKKFLIKVANPQDRRSFELELTSEGKKAVKINQAFHEEIVNEITDYCDQTEEDVKDVLEGLMHYFSKRH